MTKNTQILSRAFLLLSATATFGATATFVPLSPTTVPPGTVVSYEVTLSVVSLASFDAADVIIGSPTASDLSFVYSPEWDQAFLNITGPLTNVGFYSHDVFVGGNNPAAVGTSLKLGVVTIGTTGLTPGIYTVQIDPAVDGGVSKLSRGDLRDALSGSANFTVQCVASDVNCDGDLDLVDHESFASCLGGPGVSLPAQCQRFDGDADGDVDLQDARSQFASFTGPR